MFEWFVCFDKTKCGVIKMAKFWTEDDQIISSDHLYDQMNDGGNPIMENTNRNYIHGMCAYDLLCKIQKEMYSGERCVIKAITEKERKCLKVDRDGFLFRDCDKCISNWMNEEKS